MLTYPIIDPVALEIGQLAIRWYSLAYIVGIVAGWLYAGKLNKISKFATKEQFDAILNWVIFGILIGGRLGYVLFYRPLDYIHAPEQIVMLWKGGMSFHGGMLGVIIAMYIFCRRNGIKYFKLMDVAACVASIGLFLGRLANFVNGELYGRVTSSYFAMIFPNSDGYPRHPSQLYEAAGEGIVLFILANILFWVFKAYRKTGFLSGFFLLYYGCFRIFIEQFREPDQGVNLLFGEITRGQLLSAPMIIGGVYLILRSLREPKTANN